MPAHRPRPASAAIALARPPRSPGVAVAHALLVLLAALSLLVTATALAAAAPARTTADLNLRTGPGTNFAIVGSMPRGALVEVLGCRGSWCEVAYRGRVGWASSNFLAQDRTPRGRPDRVRPAQPEVFPFPFPVPIPGFDTRPERPRPGVGRCREQAALWLIGRRATDDRLEAALEASGARTLRVERPGRAYTQEFRRDRLTVEVDRRDIVDEVACR